jgi:hypothetical protein
LIGLGILAFLTVVKWIADPARSRAFIDPTMPAKIAVVAHAIPAVIPAAPAVSIVFILDSSPSMQPRIGRDYFELARDGVAEFLSLPGFPDDGTYEISVIQYAKKNVPGYIKGKPGFDGAYHWFGPLRVVTEEALSDDACNPNDPQDPICTTKTEINNLAAGLEHTEHFTGTLLESGLREAALLTEDESQGNSQTQFHIILVGTGEYRLPDPCPPASFRLDPGCATCSSNCTIGTCDCPGSTCDASPYNESCEESGVCNRACHIRCYANMARIIQNKPVRISAIHLGPEYHHYYPTCSGWSAEALAPYGSNDCSTPHQPDRAGFLKELANTNNNAANQPCTSQPRGRYERIAPDVAFGSPGPPGTAIEISRAIAEWLCEWAPPGSGGTQNADNDFFDEGGAKQRPILGICDNCPDKYNPRQRDCDDNGVGDLCDLLTEACGGSPSSPGLDSDQDGLCDAVDKYDGDDCLVRFWQNDADCLDPINPANCDCDCDNNGMTDFRQAAAERKDVSIYPWVFINGEFTDDGLDAEFLSDGVPDGIPDCAQQANPTCPRSPSECILSPAAGYMATFDEYAGGSAADWLTDRNWKLIGDVSQDSFISIDPDFPYTQSTPPNPITSEDAVGTGLLAIADGFEGTLLSPGFTFGPIDSCTGSQNQSGNFARCSLIGDWSFIAIDVDLKINNNNDKVWELAIQEPCTRTCSSEERIILRFKKTGAASDGGVWVVQRSPAPMDGGEDCIPTVEIETQTSISYKHDQWFRLKILIDNTDPYSIASSTAPCVFALADGHAIRLSLRRNSTQSLSVFYDEVSRGRAWQHRGVQLRAQALNNAVCGASSCPSLLIGKVVVRRADGCELWSPETCNSLDTSPCTCECAAPRWTCTGVCP